MMEYGNSLDEIGVKTTHSLVWFPDDMAIVGKEVSGQLAGKECNGNADVQ